MAEPIKISTSKYIKQGKVDVDGNIWDVVIPGAGTELRFSQASRMLKLYGARVDNLEKKFDALDRDQKSVPDADLDLYEEYSAKYRENEQIVYEILQHTFKDGSEDNATVKQWLHDTPMVIIMKAFDDLKQQTSGVNDQGAEDGQSEPPAST